MSTVRVFLLLALLGVLVWAPVAWAQEGSPDHGHEHGASEAGACEHDHGASESEGHGDGEDTHSHLPLQLYAIKAYFEAPWRDPTQPGRLALQAGFLALVDAALLAWLWRRWWR